MKLVHIGLQFRVGKTVDDLAVLDDVKAVGDRGSEPEILLFIFSPWILREDVFQTPR